MAANIETLTAAGIARMLQFGDSALPVGAFSFSSGLESAVQQKLVTDVATLRDFVKASVQQSATGDGVGLILAHRAAADGDMDELTRIDQAIFRRKLSESTREMSIRMGKKFAEVGVSVTQNSLLVRWLWKIKSGESRGTYAAGLGVLFAALGLDACSAFVAHQNGIATAILGASLRLMRVSHLETQAILFEVNAGIPAAYEYASRVRLEDMAGFAPMLDIFSAVHAQAHVRLFMN